MRRTVRSARPDRPSARDVAVDILVRVDRGGAFANILLHHRLDRARLPAADAALATELVLGVLRHRRRLDWTLQGVAAHPLDDLPPPIRAILRTGAYQVLFLSRIPARAAIHQAVELAKAHGHAGTAALVNAVLRRIASSGERPLPPAADAVTRIAVEHSHPEWLVRRWIARIGVEDTAALCAADNLPAPLHVRLNLLRGTPEDLIGRLRAAGATVLPTVLPEGIEVRGEFTERRRLAAAGWLTVQDLGAMLVTHILDPQPGETVIDACAAPGGKTTHIVERMADSGRVLACDVHERKLAAAVRRAAAGGASIIEPHVLDARVLGQTYPDLADRVLVDAPCTGLGVIRRRPDIKWRLRPDDIAALAALQGQILAGAAGAVRPGGLLVYSVCTTEPEEGAAVVASFLEARRDFVPDPLPPMEGVVPTGRPDLGMMSVWPHRQGTDGFFIARLRRRPIDAQR
ncbi:MAG TPA: 16S rRNA (cytosine(967)-C(5))-methyltransferase RsmB [bacterium]|nr:16S rRNA (cytosine(967)-C(5))-methyltransferase RsmB [bacterium]